ncbi:MAG: acetyl-CoA acetyltransferase [Phycisphaeraceae bacterium]|nr:MAG: acetyl-CoA acetyltransferase [Phycisphaeraceae bacterium]
MSEQPVIVAAKRTPIGRFMGGFSRTPATELGAVAISAVLDAAPALRGHVDEVLMGNVLQAGLGQNPARQAALKAGIPTTINAVTVNKVCGSGLETVMQAARAIKAGDSSCVIAGGMENMTLAPHYVYARAGVKFGEAKLEDHMQHDGLFCVHENWGMTSAADHIAEKYAISREEQDRFSAQSHQRAAEATKNGWFGDEIVALTGAQVGNRKAPGPDGGVSADEGIRADSTTESLGKLRTVPGHTCITAGNASQISDGAAAVAVCSASKAEEVGVKPMAKILSYHTHGVDPKDIFAAPIGGIAGALDKAGLVVGDIDLFELNEAFAAQVLCNTKELKVDEAKLNICGGGMALGHPIGASGARVLTTLLYQLKRTGGKRGVAALCLGGGNAVAMVVEAV